MVAAPCRHTVAGSDNMSRGDKPGSTEVRQPLICVDKQATSVPACAEGKQRVRSSRPARFVQLNSQLLGKEKN